jgi:kinetochore protein NDC80
MAPGPIRDPRPIRDKNFIQQNINYILDYLSRAGFGEQLTVKSLQAPTTKTFQNIFRFLYAKFDPKYQFQKKFEEEVPQLIKSLR